MNLTAAQRRAPERLASDPRGITEALMLAYGFRRKMLAGLVLASHATVITEASERAAR